MCGGHAEVGEGTLRGGWGGALGWPRLWRSPQGQEFCRAEQWGLGADHTAHFCRCGETSYSRAFPRPSWGSTPIFAPKWGPGLPQPGWGRDNRAHLSGGSGERSQSEAECVRNLERSLPVLRYLGLGGQQAQASSALQPHHSDPGPAPRVEDTHGPGDGLLSPRCPSDTHLFLFKVGELGRL